MQKFTSTEWEQSNLAKLITTVGELQDHRLAVIYSTYFDLTDYIGCEDGNTYSVIEVRKAEDCFNVSDVGTWITSEGDNLVDVYVFTNDLFGAQFKFTELIGERLRAFN